MGGLGGLGMVGHLNFCSRGVGQRHKKLHGTPSLLVLVVMGRAPFRASIEKLGKF